MVRPWGLRSSKPGAGAAEEISAETDMDSIRSLDQICKALIGFIHLLESALPWLLHVACDQMQYSWQRRELVMLTIAGDVRPLAGALSAGERLDRPALCWQRRLWSGFAAAFIKSPL